MKSNSFVVLFGSMAAFLDAPLTGRFPRDIDVAFGGDLSADDAEKMIRAWIGPRLNVVRTTLEQEVAANAAALETAEQRADQMGSWDEMYDRCGYDREWARERIDLDARINSLSAPSARLRAIGQNFPVESHRFHARNGVVTLTVPTGATGHAVIIFGDVAVQFVEVESLPGIIRVHHGSPDLCVELCLNYLERVGTKYAGLWREFRFELWNGADDAAYTRDGLTAVRNARTHCTTGEWAAIVAGLGDFGPVLEAMSTSGGLNPEFRAAHKGAACAGGSAVLCLDWKGKTFFYPYGDARDGGFTFSQIVSLL